MPPAPRPPRLRDVPSAALLDFTIGGRVDLSDRYIVDTHHHNVFEASHQWRAEGISWRRSEELNRTVKSVSEILLLRFHERFAELEKDAGE
eukprot:gene37518-25770_t